LTYAQPDLP